MKKLLLIDRDGTLIKEDTTEYKIDSFQKLEFYPDVFFYLRKIFTELDYELLMVTNQDGMGREEFPGDSFWPVQQFVIQSFENERIFFSEVLIDTTYPAENAPTRKPLTGLLEKYIQNPDYDLKASLVIGDRITDVQLAKNLDCKACWLNNGNLLGIDEISDELPLLMESVVVNSPNWEDIYLYLADLQRKNG